MRTIRIVLVLAALALSAAIPAVGRPLPRNPFLAPLPQRTAPPPTPPPMPTIQRPAAPTVSGVTVLGTLRNHDRVALIRNQGVVEAVRAGDTVQGFRVLRVGDRTLWLRRGSVRLALPLDRPSPPVRL